jgi:uncharacterized protein (DUF885 family)
MRWSLAKTVEGEPFEDYNFVFSQFSGVQVGLVNFMTNTHPLRRAADVDSYLARLDQVATRIDEAIARGRSAASRNLIPPRVILERAQSQVDKFLEPTAAQNVLVTSLDKRTAALADLDPKARAAAIEKATRIVQAKIIPAYGRIKAFMAEVYPRTGDVVGVSRLPDGAAAYAHDLSNFTSTSLSAEQIHAIGLREVARIEGEMDKLLRELNYVDGTVQARFDRLSDSVRPPADPDPRPKLVEEYTRIVRDAEKRAETLFDLRPKAPVEVRREPLFTEKTAAAHYSGPARDATRPGIVWIPLPEPRENSQWTGAGVRSVAYHEGVPGHHFQVALAQELPDVPRFRQYGVFGGSTAFSEGWGLYAERLAAEAGWYDGDPKGRLGQLNAELFRARRLVVDTGLHAKHWTRQQAIDYGIQPSEVDRYVAMPGQACAYKIGELEILRLRAKAQQALGSKFSMKEFHNVVLRSGSVPLDVLGQAIDDWIAAIK